MNLNREEKQALKELQENDTFVIKPADKGGAIVIWDKTDYRNEAQRQLNNISHYTKTRRDLTVSHTLEINQYLREMFTKNIITSQEFEFLRIKNPRTPIFYLLPKIHKTNTPGRPIISAVNSPTEKISQYVDYYLKPLATSTKSYIKDTTDFLSKLSTINQISEETFLVTIDVVSLYTNIPHSDGLKATSEALLKRQQKHPPTFFLLKLILFILKKNNFTFDNQHYLQTQGTSMGTRMAPNYSIITMAKLEEDFLNTQTLLPTVWWR